MNRILWSIRGGSLAVIALLLSFAGGCTSAISTTYLRDALWDVADHASGTEDEAESAPDSAAVAEDSTDSEPPVPGGEALDTERRAAAIDEAVARLRQLGPIDDATRATLVDTLQRTQQEDWPVVVEAFASTLEAAGSSRAAAEVAVDRASPPVVPAAHVVAKADLDEVAIEPLPAAAVAVAPAALPPEPQAAPEPEPEHEPDAAASAPKPPTLAVRNACFASRVQGWGVIDRFTQNRFRPGQEVIVYFELDELSAGESSAGHTTCIDATLTLVGPDGTVGHEWSFEPIAETCRARRHDYFARYVIRLPELVQAGTCRIDVAVVDTLAGTTARAALPLEILVAPGLAD